MVDIVFLALAAISIGSAVAALEAREIVYGAVALGVSFLGLAGFFIILDAPFVALFQITVYVGAVVVLILFTVMLVRREKLAKTPAGWERAVGILAAAALAIGMGSVAFASGLQRWVAPQGGAISFREIGVQLITQYGPALLILGLVLAAAVIGALTLAKVEREEK